MVPEIASFVSWYVAASLAGAAALPLAFRLFHLLPDRGFSLARPLGLLTIGYVFWLLGSLGFFQNEASAVLLSAAMVLAAGLAWLGPGGLAEWRAWLRENARLALGVEAVFLLAFAGWAWVRAQNPEIVGTEKPMEYMFINAVLRSPGFPPHDAWLSGHAISYYYFGYVIVAALAKVTGVAASVAFNLGLALLFALTCTGALGVVLNLISLTHNEERGGRSEEGDAKQPASAFWPALLAPLLIVLAGNFYGVLRLAHANGFLGELQVPAVYYAFGDAASGSAPGVRAGLVNVWTWLDLKGMQGPPSPSDGSFDWNPGFWWWFNGARVTHDKNLVGQETEAITEMPAFSFILGDMHPHVLGLPFVFLPIAAALNWLLLARCWPPPALAIRLWEAGSPVRPLLPSFVLTALLLGGLSFLNTWDFPIYLFVVTGALTLGLGQKLGWDELWRHWRLIVAFALGLALLGVALYLPFYFTLQSQLGGILPNLIWPTRFQQTVVMFAHVLLGVVLFVGWLAVRERARFDGRAALWAGAGIVVLLLGLSVALSSAALLTPALSGVIDSFIAPLTRQEATSLMWQRRLVDSLTALVAAILIGLTVGLAVGALRSKSPAPPSLASVRPATWNPAVLMVLVLLLTGALLLIGPEFVYLRDLFGYRMNTIFKFYFQTWVMWGLAAAFGLWYLARHAQPVTWVLAASVLTIATAASLVYTGAAIYSRMQEYGGPKTLDGMATYVAIHPNEWAAANWLKENTTGTPVIAEAVGGSYSEYGRIAMISGLPTVMGWEFHEAQWRGPYYDQVSRRPGDIAQLYQSRDWETTREVLERYGIEYVVVSDYERRRYGRVAEEKFMHFMQPVFQAGDLTIYRRLDGDGS